MSYELDQDTALECIDEWPEPDEYGFDYTPPLHSYSSFDYDVDDPYDTWNGDEDEMKEAIDYDEQQLEQPSYQKQEHNYHSDQNWFETLNRLAKSDEINYGNQDFSIITKEENLHSRTDSHELNIEIQNQNKKEFDLLLKNRKLGRYAEDIYHYTSEMNNPKYQQYAIVVDESTYKKYRYYNAYIREENTSYPSGYKTEWLGYAHKESLTYYPPDEDWKIPTYRVRIDDKKRFILKSDFEYEQLAAFFSRDNTIDACN